MAKVQYATLEVWVVVDENGDGDCAIGDESVAATRYDENIGGDHGSIGLRRVKLTVKVPLPAVIELAGEVTVDESGASLRAV